MLSFKEIITIVQWIFAALNILTLALLVVFIKNHELFMKTTKIMLITFAVSLLLMSVKYLWL
jgi:hypothetical protein